MLVLSRRVGEEIIINSNISIRIVGVQNGKVRLAISAPPDPDSTPRSPPLALVPVSSE